MKFAQSPLIHKIRFPIQLVCDKSDLFREKYKKKINSAARAFRSKFETKIAGPITTQFEVLEKKFAELTKKLKELEKEIDPELAKRSLEDGENFYPAAAALMKRAAKPSKDEKAKQVTYYNTCIDTVPVRM